MTLSAEKVVWIQADPELGWGMTAKLSACLPDCFQRKTKVSAGVWREWLLHLESCRRWDERLRVLYERAST